MKREYVDFDYIPEHQLPMHWRLVNWSRSVVNSAPSSVSPMFQQYRSSEVYGGGGGKIPFDAKDADIVGKAVVALPTANLLAINWWYVKPCAPSRAAKGMQCTLAQLAQYVVDGRERLIERLS